MCSVDPDEIVEMTRATDGLNISSGNVMCRRCGTEKAVVVLRVKDPYCKECFLTYFVHKFRSTIGKSKQIRPGDRILIATSGGLSSSALLHLVRGGFNETSQKKLRFEPAFLYIDESCLSDDPNTGPVFIHQVCSNTFEFPAYFTSLEQIMSPQPSPPTLFTKDGHTKPDTNLDLKDKIKKLLYSCKSESAQQDLHEQLRRELLYQCAAALGYQKIFLGDNSSTLSVIILANVALGRGSQLSDRVQFKACYKDMEVYRPMREILENEIRCYNSLHNISTIQAPSLKLKGSSITSCTEEFIMGLQREFPATIPTIFRTGDKLISTSTDVSKCSTPDLNDDSDKDLNYLNCAMCGAQLDTIQSEVSALNATLVSQKLSCMGISAGASQKVLPNESSKIHINNGSNNVSTIKNCDELNIKKEDANDCNKDSSNSNTTTNTCDCSQPSRCCSSNKSALKEECNTNNVITKNIIENYLCYGCRIIVRELAEVNHLPVKVRSAVAEQERRKHMREQIQDFLL